MIRNFVQKIKKKQSCFKIQVFRSIPKHVPDKN